MKKTLATEITEVTEEKQQVPKLRHPFKKWRNDAFLMLFSVCSVISVAKSFFQDKKCVN